MKFRRLARFPGIALEVMKIAQWAGVGGFVTVVGLVLSSVMVSGQDKPAGGEKEVVEAPAEKSLAQRLLGYWAIDREQMLKAMMKRAEENSGQGKLDAGAKELMGAMVNQMAARMILEFAEAGVSVVHSPGFQEKGKYSLLEADEESGDFTLGLKPEGKEEADPAKAHLEGDLLEMMTDGLELHFLRLDAEQGKARCEALAAMGEEPPADAEEGDPEEEQ